MRSHRSRRLGGALTGAVLMLTVALPASAHVSIIDGVSVPSGGHGTQISFRVGHGCDGAPTDTIEIQVPEGVTGVQPKWIAGWTAETEPRAAAEASLAPDASSEADHPEVAVVRWSGGPLPDDQYLDFQMLAVFPETPGAVLYFPVVQRCGDEESAWIEIPAEGQDPEGLDSPAPSVTIGEPAEDH
jgi:uncharacterized protein YcnI